MDSIRAPCRRRTNPGQPRERIARLFKHRLHGVAQANPLQSTGHADIHSGRAAESCWLAPVAHPACAKGRQTGGPAGRIRSACRTWPASSDAGAAELVINPDRPAYVPGYAAHAARVDRGKITESGSRRAVGAVQCRMLTTRTCNFATRLRLKRSGSFRPTEPRMVSWPHTTAYELQQTWLTRALLLTCRSKVTRLRMAERCLSTGWHRDAHDTLPSPTRHRIAPTGGAETGRGSMNVNDL